MDNQTQPAAQNAPAVVKYDGPHGETDAFKKLPKWAQHELQKLRADVSSLETQLAAALGSVVTRVEVNPYGPLMGREHRCFLPVRETIRFHFGQKFIDVRLEADVLNIMGGDTISISPRAANVVWIKPTMER